MARAAPGPKSRLRHPIWQHDEAVIELARLTAIVFSFDLRTKSGPDAFKRFVEAINETRDEDIDAPDGADGANSIYRLINFQSLPDESWIIEMVAGYVDKRLQKLSAKSRTDRMKGRLDVLEAYRAHMRHELEAFPQAYSADSDIPVQAPSYIDIRQDQFEAASIYFTSCARVPTRKRNDKRAFFACYRYSVGVSEISKNHFTIFPCTDSDPVCRFENTFKDRHGNPRHSAGVVFKEGNWVYLVGRIDGDIGIKAVAISAVGKDRPTLVQALVMSKVKEPLVSRAAIEHLDRPMPEQDIRVSDERTDPEFSSPEFRSRIVPLIQNGVAFKSFDRIIYKPPNGKEREVSQADMVQMVPQLLTGEFVLRALDGKDRPFNPASHEFYPFNQAITIRDQ